MKLSILDQAPVSSGNTAREALEATIELAKLADKLGYTRYWVAEHHDLKGLASPAPDILLGIIGSKTERIRIGSGAVLLPNYKPFNIAERYNLLATMYPGRVDIGLGRAPGGSAEVSIALAGNFLEQVKKMPALLDELDHFLHRDFPDDHLFSKVSAAPMPVLAPVPWLLGTSKRSAILAAEKEMAYVFGHFMSDQDGHSIVKTYRDNFKQGTPKVIVTVSVICAETTEAAEEIALSNLLWRVQQNKGESKDGVPSIEEAHDYIFNDEELVMIEKMKEKQIIGTPQEVRMKLEELQAAYQTDEMMIVTNTHDYEARRKSYQLIAEAFDLADTQKGYLG
ncbi:LLM class flavin-dependent oxidoreductase [Oceanobacillus chungangensis]|uniref:LLM class flavin-dependent oxidoreductase n=1 Tax=Oceanobacillus chungangensis TaxID=1229152 RepID=A0A3D8PXN3_9BACI|nr:LLM class flavin-dependent oxidoreductase [Oceanobacillus chungangensis]RDW20906.1 LLM class flavin-dependent oxidoreductase [Oceanobacillus chungangensis]